MRSGEGWRFDAARGKEEVLARRIGRNELAAIEVCRAIVDAQREYAASAAGKGAYAQRFVSQKGQRDGLYWQSRPGEPASPLGALAAEAESMGYTGDGTGGTGAPRPFHGYCFRMLTSQGTAAPGGQRNYIEKGRMTGGFAVVAWPAEYENSGIMTFLVSHSGVVYEKDLGANTSRDAAAMTAFDPGEAWEPVPESDTP